MSQKQVPQPLTLGDWWEGSVWTGAFVFTFLFIYALFMRFEPPLEFSDWESVENARTFSGISLFMVVMFLFMALITRLIRRHHLPG